MTVFGHLKWQLLISVIFYKYVLTYLFSVDYLNEAELTLQQDRDCLVIKLTNDEAKIIKRPRKVIPQSFFPKHTLDTLQEKLEMYDTIHQKTLPDDGNLHVHKFVILCETFLQMYHVIFNKLKFYILKDERNGTSSWQQNPQVPFLMEEHLDFDVSTS